MRIDPDTCRDPDLLAAEVRRLRAAIPLVALERDRLAVRTDILETRLEVAQQRGCLTDAEREAVAYYVGTGGPHGVDATLRGLLERLSTIAACDNDARLAALDRLVASDQELERDYPDPENAPKHDTTPAQGSVPPEWLARPYWVDPPSGWLYGFPRLYDPATDGDMTAWMIANGYPQRLARQGLPCTFTAAE